jgi:Uncharacterised protein family (UPF0236)
MRLTLNLAVLERLAAGARNAFADLERWLFSHTSADHKLHLIEAEEERRGREVLRLMLQAHIDSRGNGDVGDELTVFPAGSVREIIYRHKRLRSRRLITLFGEVSITRLEYSAPGQKSLYPLDAVLGLPARSYSYEIQRRLVKAVVKGPFDEAIEEVADATGVSIPKRTAEQIVVEASVDFQSFYTQRTLQLNPKSGPFLVASVDGKGVPMVKSNPGERKVRLRKGEKRNKKRMSTVGAVFTQKPNIRTPEAVVESLFAERPESRRRKRYHRPEQKRVWASLLSGKEAFFAQVQAEMRRRDPKHRKTWIVVTDGERALQLQITATFDRIELVLDLLHVLEKLWAVSYVFHPEGSPEAREFVRERILRILRGKVSQVVKGLRQMATKRRLKGPNRATVLGAAAYYYRNRLRMRYDFYLRKGYPIASGSVEGACKNLVKDRMERSGMRWTLPMAEALLQLRAIYLSDHFEEYWQYHIEQDQQRLFQFAQCPTAVAKK